MMLLVESALKGYAVDANDGIIGSVADCLFDQGSWKLRWRVVDTDGWLTGRKVLIHPSALGRPDIYRVRLPDDLTKAQIKASADISLDFPISEQMEQGIYGYYGWDPEWGGGGYFAGCPSGYGEAPMLDPPMLDVQVLDRPGSNYRADQGGGDPNLRSMAAVKGYHVEATDGPIGHIENFVIDDVGWDVRYLIVDTKNWWFGQHVLISPFAVRHIDWMERNVRLDVSRDRVRNRPAWKPLDLIDKAYQERLPGYCAWPGYGF